MNNEHSQEKLAAFLAAAKSSKLTTEVVSKIDDIEKEIQELCVGYENHLKPVSRDLIEDVFLLHGVVAMNDLIKIFVEQRGEIDKAKNILKKSKEINI